MKQILLGLLLKYAKRLFDSIRTKHEAAIKSKLEKRLDDLFKVVDKDKVEQIKKVITSEPLSNGGWVINKSTGQSLEDYKGIIGTESVMSKDVMNKLSAGWCINNDPVLTGSIPFVSGFTIVPQLLVKKLNPAAQLPLQTGDNAGYDLYAIETVIIPPGERRLIKTGIAINTPFGYYASIRNRSGMSFKNGGDVLAGVIDHGYCGEVGVVLLNTDKEKEIIINIGDRPAQFIIEKYASFEIKEVTEFSESKRGESGYGSSGS